MKSWKTFGWSLFKVLVIWTIGRIIVQQPNVAIQDAETMVIVGSALAFCWLVLAFIKESWSGLYLALNLSIVTAFFFLRWGDLGLMNVKIAILSLFIMSAAICFYEFIRLLRKEKMVWLPVVLNILILLLFLSGLEALMPLFF